MNEGFNLDDLRRSILPKNASDVYRNRLAYLTKVNLDNTKPATHFEQIKEMFRKFSLKWELDIPDLDRIIELADVFCVTSMLKVLKDIQKDLKVKRKKLGGIFFDDEKQRFIYYNFKPREDNLNLSDDDQGKLPPNLTV